MTSLLRCSTRKVSTWHTSLRRPPAYHNHDIFLYRLFQLRIFGPGRSTLATCLAIVGISIGTFCVRNSYEFNVIIAIVTVP